MSYLCIQHNDNRPTYVVFWIRNLYGDVILWFISKINDYLLFQTCFICRNFCVRTDFVSNPKTLKKRLMVVGLGMLVLSPFLVIFMLVYLFLRHAEQFYNHPSTASSQRWSNLSKWIFREFNEVLFLPSSLIKLSFASVCLLHAIFSW